MMLTMAPAAAVTYPIILALGAALFLMGAGVGIAALGMAELVKAVNPGSAAAFVTFAGALQVFALGVISLAAALTLMGNPLALMGVWNLGRVFEKLETSAVNMGPAAIALGEILGQVKEIDKYGLGPIETSFKNIATSINSINLVKLVAMKALLNTSTKALKAAEAVGFRASPGGGGGGPGGGGPRDARPEKARKITIPIELKLDKEKFGEAVIEVQGNKGRQMLYGET
jgi:ABC-type multidrug transport system fused ATPase/permease subunit